MHTTCLWNIIQTSVLGWPHNEWLIMWDNSWFRTLSLLFIILYPYLFIILLNAVINCIAHGGINITFKHIKMFYFPANITSLILPTVWWRDIRTLKADYCRAEVENFESIEEIQDDLWEANGFDKKSTQLILKENLFYWYKMKGLPFTIYHLI